MRIQSLLAAAFVASVIVAPATRASVLLAVDRQPAGAPTQAGFLAWETGNSISDNGITLTQIAQNLHSGGLRDRNPPGSSIAGNFFADLLEDFIHGTADEDPGPNDRADLVPIDITLQLSGLIAGNTYRVTLWSHDSIDNNGRGSSWHLGTDGDDPVLAAYYNDNDVNVDPAKPVGPAFSQVFVATGGGTLTFFGRGDYREQGDGLELGDPLTNNSASVIVFNGLQVEGVPEPGTLGLLGLGIAGVGLARRRKRTA